jgi:hypothetical protein
MRKTLKVTSLSLGLALTPAYASVHANHHTYHRHHCAHHHTLRRHRAYADGRPRAWCGWYMRTLYGGGPEYNLARNWAERGEPSAAAIGVIVVWPHHVGLITGRTPGGQWIVKSGNDGHVVRERPRSVANAISFRRISRA